MDGGHANERVRVPGARCPYCHEEVPRGEEPAVCVACHALHHAGCLQEHGACAACGAAHPRFGVREVRRGTPAADLEGPWEPGRQPRTLLTLVLLGLVVLGASVADLFQHQAPDAAIRRALLLAALTGVAATVWRGALFGWGIASSGAAFGLMLVLAADMPFRRANDAEVRGWSAALLVVGIGLLIAHLRRAWRRPAHARPDASKR